MKNIFKFKDTVHNSITEEYDIPDNLDLLNKWTIPKIEPKTVYKIGAFDRLSFKQVVKTTEDSTPLHEEEMVVKLLSRKDILPYIRTHKFLHIGCIQIAFRPLTLEGLPESFLAALRDGRNLNWKQSLMGIIQSSLAHGPVYFDVYPNLSLSLSDINILDSLTLNVKTNGYNYTRGTEVICICYRIYFKPLYTLNPMCQRIDKQNNETILIETNFNRSNITTRRPIKWDEITFPDNWVIEKAIPRNPIVDNNLQHIFQSDEGLVQIQFANEQRRLLTSSSSVPRSRSSRSYLSPLDYNVEIPQTSRASTSHYREDNKEDHIDEIIINKNNIVHGNDHIHNNVHRVRETDTLSDINFNL